MLLVYTLRGTFKEKAYDKGMAGAVRRSSAGLWLSPYWGPPAESQIVHPKFYEELGSLEPACFRCRKIFVHPRPPALASSF